jgi:hypothetical protein
MCFSAQGCDIAATFSAQQGVACSLHAKIILNEPTALPAAL